MTPRSLSHAERAVLLCFLESAADGHSLTLGECQTQHCAGFRSWEIVEAFDNLLALGLLIVQPCVRLEIRAEMFGRFKDEGDRCQTGTLSKLRRSTIP